MVDILRRTPSRIALEPGRRPVYAQHQMGLTGSDAQAILEFLANVETIDGESPYSTGFLTHLAGLIPCDEAAVQHVDLQARRFMELTPSEGPEDESLYWSVGPCPIMEYRSRTADLGAMAMSDVIGRQRYHESAFYREYLRPVGLDHVLDIGLSMDGRELRSLVLLRAASCPDFSDRDRDVLAALRPHLRAREARAALYRHAQGATCGDGTSGDLHERLTPREREVIYLVAQGRSNAAIAEALWVTPGTVKKHLENIYAKIGVGSRAAAATYVQTAAEAH
jgi:DNA-binding CsgD family transcriptional regulator